MEEIIKLENVHFVYQKGTPFEFCALKDISISIKKGEMVGIIGPTGSGKSTLIQHFNGLLKPTKGRVLVNGKDIHQRDKTEKKSICFEVGLVFQYPEYQLFEETVYDDIAFGPRNMGLPEDEIEHRVKESMEWMGLSFEKIKNRSPFSLSGGEMRRVALAGVLAMKPDVLVLDEPTAGLDPKGCFELEEKIKKLHKEKGMTLVLVTHEMQKIAQMVNHLIILKDGKVVADGTPTQIFQDYQWIEKIGLGLPPYMELMVRLKEKGFNVKTDVLTAEDAKKEILKLFKT